MVPVEFNPFSSKPTVGVFHGARYLTNLLFIDLEANVGTMSFAPLAARSRIYRGYHYLSKTISFWPYLRVTLSCNDPYNPFVN